MGVSDGETNESTEEENAKEVTEVDSAEVTDDLIRTTTYYDQRLRCACVVSTLFARTIHVTSVTDIAE